jgi:hypothetical protein
VDQRVGCRAIISDAKKTGARKSLDDEQRRVAAGWVLSQETKVDLRRYRSFVADQLDVTISPSTASRYMDEADLSRRMLGSRPRDKGVSFEQYAKEGYDYIVGLHNDGFFSPDPSLVWAVDFTSTAIKQQRYFTYGPKGGKQQKYSKGEHVYTDNIFTAMGLDGSIIPPHAFTANPQLRPNSQVLVQLCKKYDVDPAMVVFCPGAKNWVGDVVHGLHCGEEVQLEGLLRHPRRRRLVEAKRRGHFLRVQGRPRQCDAVKPSRRAVTVRQQLPRHREGGRAGKQA